MNDLLSLAGKVAIVTGGGRGLGKAIACGFAAHGAAVVVAEKEPRLGASAVDEIVAAGHRALLEVTDVCSGQQVDRMIEKTITEFGRIDIIVNNAGGTRLISTPILECTEEQWDAEFALNIKSVFLCSKAAAKAMIAAGIQGSIVNLSSLGAFSCNQDRIPYGAAKGAVRSFTDGLAKALAGHGIRVNAIAPGRFATDLVAEVYAGARELNKARNSLIPMGRMGEPSEIVGLALFLASGASSYVTGQTIIIGGGLDSTLAPRDYLRTTEG